MTVEQNACDLWQAKALLKLPGRRAEAYEALLRLAAEAGCAAVRAHAEDVLADCGIPVFHEPAMDTTVDGVDPEARHEPIRAGAPRRPGA